MNAARIPRPASSRCACAALLVFALALAAPPGAATAQTPSPTPRENSSNAPLYLRYPPEKVIVGDVDSGHFILTRRELEKRATMMVPRPGRNADAVETQEYRRQLRRAEGKALEEWAILKTLVRQAQLQGIRVSPGDVQQAMQELMEADAEQSASAAKAPSAAKALGITEEELREQVGDALLIDRYLEADIRKRVSDNELKAIYERNPTQFIEPAAVKVRQIFRRIDPSMSLEEKKDIRKDFYNLLKKARRRDGRDFEELARKESDYPNARDNAGDMGWVDFTLPMDRELMQAIQDLQPGEISDIVETKAGLHIVRVEEQRPAKGTQWGEFARERVVTKIMFDLKNRLGSAVLKTAPFSIRINSSGLRLVGEPSPTARPSRPARTLRDEPEAQEETPQDRRSRRSRSARSIRVQ